MKIKIINDKNDFLIQMFQDTLKTYNYIKTDIILYLIYGEDVKWTYVQEEDVFYLKKFIKDCRQEEFNPLLLE